MKTLEQKIAELTAEQKAKIAARVEVLCREWLERETAEYLQRIDESVRQAQGKREEL
jgi:hypothetical protein